MHDPMVVAFDVPAPWLRRAFTRRRDDTRRWAVEARRRTNPENLGERVYPWWRPKGYCIVLAGCEYRPRTLATVWHVEPGGHDSGEICRHHYRDQSSGEYVYDGSWRWHVWHWRIQLPPLQALRRRLLTRCEWCHGPHRKGSPVNCSTGGSRPRSTWWRGESGLCHSDCHAAMSAAKSCTCDDPLLRYGDYGTCAWCGLSRGYGREEWATANDRDLKTVARGQKPSPALMATVCERFEASRS